MKNVSLKRMLLLVLAMVALTATAKTDFYKLSVKNAEGKDVKMKQFKGKVLLVVNTATHCGFTPQYKELEQLYQRYHSQGLEVLDFPCNQFGQQAPGSIEEIQQFCTSKYDTHFLLFDKVDVNGEQVSPLFTWLKEQLPFQGFSRDDKRAQYMHNMLKKKDENYDKSSDVKWNFTKFLIDRKGNPVRRFEPTESIDDVEEAIRKLL